MEEGNDYLLRLYEPTGIARETKVCLPALGMASRVSLKPFEVKTYRISPSSLTMEETTLMEGL